MHIKKNYFILLFYLIAFIFLIKAQETISKTRIFFVKHYANICSALKWIYHILCFSNENKINLNTKDFNQLFNTTLLNWLVSKNRITKKPSFITMAFFIKQNINT